MIRNCKQVDGWVHVFDENGVEIACVFGEHVSNTETKFTVKDSDMFKEYDEHGNFITSYN